MAGIWIRKVTGIHYGIHQRKKHWNIRPLPNQRIYPTFEIQKILDRYDDLYSMDMFGESIEGHKYKTSYQVVKMISPNSKEDMELLQED